MSRRYKEMPPLWRIQELFELSDDHPTGLAWKIRKASHRPGDQAGRYNAHLGYYLISIDAVVYLTHRVVYYLRTGEDPGVGDVVHDSTNAEKDNRKRLTLSFEFKPKEKNKKHKRPSALDYFL